MVKPVVFQITGYQNSGKTTLISSLIKGLKQFANLEVAVLKHHGHGGTPSLPEKDSARHFETGAVASLVEGSGQIQLHARVPENQNGPLPQLIELLKNFGPDVILIEGYKKEKFPKTVIIKQESDLELLSIITNIRALVYWPDLANTLLNHRWDFPIFPLGSQAFFDWVINDIRKIHTALNDDKT
jgi:molybdopterin-guanine dinucleotide biosynthesis adapter protein